MNERKEPEWVAPEDNSLAPIVNEDRLVPPPEILKDKDKLRRWYAWAKQFYREWDAAIEDEKRRKWPR